MALTDKAIKAAKAISARKEYPDGKDGLYLVVQPSGAKSWAVRYRFDGKPRKITLPLRYPQMDLAAARQAAKEIALQVSKGHDPAAKVQPKTSDAVRTHAERFLAAYKSGHRSGDEVQRQFDKLILPAIGDKPIHAVTPDDIAGLLAPSMDAGRGYMANRTLATVRRFFSWAVDNRILKDSPAGGLKKPAPEKARDRVLSWDEVAALWAATGRAGPPYGPLVRLLLLTAQRREEVTCLRDCEIDKARTVWTIPGDRAKNGKEHEVPLTKAMLAELDGVRRIAGCEWVFTTNGTTPFQGHSKCKVRLDGELGFAEPWRLHDIRRTVATGLAELRTPPHVIEAILNHKSGQVSGIAAVYNRHDYFEEKAQALVAWNRFLEIICDDKMRALYDRMRTSVRRREGIGHDRAVRYRDLLLKSLHGDEQQWQRTLRRARIAGALTHD